MLNSKNLLHWYDQNARHLPWRITPHNLKSGTVPDPYRVWLSEIMLQQTTIVTVVDYYQRFLAKWPTIADLACAPLEEVLKIWAGLGYYARARNLHACARIVATELKGVFPTTACDLQNLPGIGPYTSAAIAAICYDQMIAVIDGNVERVCARYMALPTPVHQARKKIHHLVQTSVPTRSGDFAQAMMDLGATLCTPTNPDCAHCPFSTTCKGLQTGNPVQFPIKLQKKKRPVRYGHAFIFQQITGEIFLQKRPDKGLLAKMAPGSNSNWQESISKVCPPISGNWQKIGSITHIFTHFRLELEIWRLRNAPKSLDLEGYWVAQDELKNQALPTLFTKVLALK